MDSSSIMLRKYQEAESSSFTDPPDSNDIPGFQNRLGATFSCLQRLSLDLIFLFNRCLLLYFSAFWFLVSIQPRTICERADIVHAGESEWVLLIIYLFLFQGW